MIRFLLNSEKKLLRPDVFFFRTVMASLLGMLVTLLKKNPRVRSGSERLGKAGKVFAHRTASRPLVPLKHHPKTQDKHKFKLRGCQGGEPVSAPPLAWAESAMTKAPLWAERHLSTETRFQG
jgi:hypothetical protein